jgi:hypothetical protein
MLRENYRWAATASSGFASVQGTAKGLPDTYDIYKGSAPDGSQQIPPQVTYHSRQFNKKGEIFFDITRKIPNDRCYFCHSTKIIDPDKKERWDFDEDVHLKAGLGCVDCHRHGLDHQMFRGYEENDNLSKNEIAASLTCRGCHLGSENSEGPPLSGRLGAPKPTHNGMPPVHFDKLSCTTCHSGNWPKEEPISIKTSMAHALGLPKVNKSDVALPRIISPVFAKGSDGKIAPHNLLWPAYWAEMQGDDIIPLVREVYLPIVRKKIGHIDSLETGNWPQLADSHLVKVLDSLKLSGLVSNIPVYISAGKIFILDENKKLIQKEHIIAKPYMWPVAHDVRPASQSLGVRSCNDCHTTDSDFYFGKIPTQSPLQMERGVTQSMATYMDQNAIAAWVFSFSFLFRPGLKYLILFSSLITFAILLFYGFRGLAKVISVVSTDDQSQDQGK